MDDFKGRNLFPKGPGNRRSGSSRTSSVDHTLADFQITIFLLCPHMRAKKEKMGSHFSSKNTNPIHVTLVSWPNYLSKASSPNAITLETWATHMNLRGHIHSIQRGVFC